jgi:hypothetical protein
MTFVVHPMLHAFTCGKRLDGNLTKCKCKKPLSGLLSKKYNLPHNQLTNTVKTTISIPYTISSLSVVDFQNTTLHVYELNDYTYGA